MTTIAFHMNGPEGDLMLFSFNGGTIINSPFPLYYKIVAMDKSLECIVQTPPSRTIGC